VLPPAELPVAELAGADANSAFADDEVEELDVPDVPEDMLLSVWLIDMS
jgi:hypothetical protein